jgi:POT family proton-dependent oligopeptide transporter
MRAPSTLGTIGLGPSTADPGEHRRVRQVSLAALGILVAIILLAMAGVIRIDAVWLAQRMTGAMVTMVVLYFLYLFTIAGLTTDEKKRAAVVVVLFFFSVVFWSAFEQAPTSLNLFARDYTDRIVFGWEMPTLWLQSANSVFVILFAPVFAAIWMALGRRGRDLSSPAKFAIGLVVTGLGFLVMVEAANIVIRGGGAVRVSPWWLVLSYMLQTTGELLISPVGLSSMTKLAPRRFAGQIMGVWFVSLALGNLIAGLVGGRVDPERLPDMPRLFQLTAMSQIGAAVLCALMIIPISRMMRDVPRGNR